MSEWELLFDGSRYLWNSVGYYEELTVLTVVRTMRIQRTILICIETYIQHEDRRTRIGSIILTVVL